MHQHTTLAVLDHGTALYVERLPSPESSRDAAHIAQRMPIHAASSGLVLLAFSPPAVQDEVLARPLAAVTAETITDPVLVRKHLAEIRQSGYVALPGIGVTEWAGIAVPVFGPDNSIAAALNAIVPGQEAVVRPPWKLIAQGARIDPVLAADPGIPMVDAVLKARHITRPPPTTLTLQ